MPRKPKRACSHPRCPQLTEGRFCEEHQKQENRRYEKYDRNPATRKRYGSAWRKIRESYVAVNPLCEECLKSGRLTAVEEVHHILPLARGGTHDHSNLMSLCKSCHSKTSANDGDRWGKHSNGTGIHHNGF